MFVCFHIKKKKSQKYNIFNNKTKISLPSLSKKKKKKKKKRIKFVFRDHKTTQQRTEINIICNGTDIP